MKLITDATLTRDGVSVELPLGVAFRVAGFVTGIFSLLATVVDPVATS